MELLKAFVLALRRVGSDFVRASRNVATLTIVSTYFSSIASRSSETPARTRLLEQTPILPDEAVKQRLATLCLREGKA